MKGMAMSGTVYQVNGMTCGHCATAVTNALNTIPGVRGVEVDVAGGRVDVTSDSPLAETAVRDAVVEAGYELVS
jgi:copper chaperone CopZ